MAPPCRGVLTLINDLINDILKFRHGHERICGIHPNPSVFFYRYEFISERGSAEFPTPINKSNLRRSSCVESTNIRPAAFALSPETPYPFTSVCMKQKSKKLLKPPTIHLLFGIPTNIAVGPLGFQAELDTNPEGEQGHPSHHRLSLIKMRSQMRRTLCLHESYFVKGKVKRRNLLRQGPRHLPLRLAIPNDLGTAFQVSVFNPHHRGRCL